MDLPKIKNLAMSVKEVFNPCFMKEMKSIMDESLLTLKKTEVEATPIMNSTVTIDRFVTQAELNFLAFSEIE